MNNNLEKDVSLKEKSDNGIEGSLVNWDIETVEDNNILKDDITSRSKKNRNIFDNARLSLKNKKKVTNNLDTSLLKKEMRELQRNQTQREEKQKCSSDNFLDIGIAKIEKEKEKEIKEVRMVRNILMNENTKAYNNWHLYNSFKNDRILLRKLVNDLDIISKRCKGTSKVFLGLPPIFMNKNNYSSTACLTQAPHFPVKNKKKTNRKVSLGPVDLLKQIHDINNNYLQRNEDHLNSRPTPNQYRFKIIRHLPYYGNTSSF